MSRSRFNRRLVLLVASLVVLFVFIEATLGRPQTLVLYPFGAWALFCLASRRLHDHGRSAAWLLLLLIPLLGPLWCFIALCCRRGTPGENQYGDDASAFHDEYLTVRFS